MTYFRLFRSTRFRMILEWAFLEAEASSAFAALAAFLAASFSALALAETERVESDAVTASVMG